MHSVFDLFLEAAERFPDVAAVEVFRRTSLETCSYREILRLTSRAARLLAAAGCGRQTACAILAENDARWCAAYLGILRLGAIAVPLDTSYTAGQVATVLDDADVRVLFTTAEHQQRACAAAASAAAAPVVVLLSGADGGLPTLDDPAGDDAQAPPSAAAPSDAACILYTSGTTSDPKGVVLTHGNLLAERDAALRIVSVDERDRVLGVLPLFHSLALVANLLLPLTVGARVVFLETLNSAEMMRALRERRITALCVVPQFFYLLHQRVLERMAARAWPARALFRGMLATNGWLRRRFHVNAGATLFRGVRAALGGRMRVMVTGGSRFDPRVGRDLYRMGLNIVQAYGLTECSGAATLLRPGDPHLESVGQPLDGVKVRILERAGGDGRDGEILIRGPIVMAGYHNRPDATAATLRDGWLHTGDLGYFDADGRLHITGRIKEVIVAASGKNIYPEEIEAVYARSPYISEICVIGATRSDDPSSERLHAIIVPDFDLMRERGIVNTRDIIRFDIEGLSLQLPHHKRVLSFDIWRDPLPRTTTRKLRRHEIARRYREQSGEPGRLAAQPERTEMDRAWAGDARARAVLQAIRAAAKPGATVTPDASLELDLGLDSMERVELLARVEQTCGVSIAEEVAQRIYTVRELVDAVLVAGAADPGADSTAADPWEQILSGESDDPAVRSILRPMPLFAPFAFAVMKTAYALAWLLVGLRVGGRENLPRDGPYLLSPNHQGYLDAFLLVASLPYRVFHRLFFVGASEYFATPFMAKIARRINVVPVDPDVNLVRAMQAGAFGLRHGRVLVLFPEGERSPDGSPRAFKKGAAILSAHLDAPIVPVAIHGAFAIWPRGGGFRWRALLPWVSTRTSLRFGAPIEAASLTATGGEPRYSALTEVLRQRVVAMWQELERNESQC